jgi:hypothetical protein
MRYILFILLMSVLFCPAVLAQAATPDNWQVHHTFSGVKASAEDHDINGGDLRFSATLKNRTRFTEYNNNDTYAYVRGRLSGVKLANGEMNINLNMRGAADSRGSYGEPKYGFFYDSLDASRGHEGWDFRLYQGNVVFDNVIKYTYLTAGRTYVEHLKSIQIDGGDLSVGTDRVSGFVYYGAPVSFYESMKDLKVAGGGLKGEIGNLFTLRGEAMQFIDSSEEDLDTFLWNGRVDVPYTVSSLTGTLYGEGGMVEDAWAYNAGGIGYLPGAKTTFTLWVKGQYERNETPVNMMVSDFEMVSGTESQYYQIGGNIYKGFGDKIAAGIGFETRQNADDFYGDRDYYRYIGSLDFIGLFEGSYISLTAEYWDIPKDGYNVENRQLYIGGKLSQSLGDMAELWLGGMLTTYRYYFKQYDILPVLAGRSNEKLDNSVYLLYAGGYCRPLTNLLLGLDFTYEISEVLTDEDGDNDNIGTVSLSANYNF